MSETDFDRLLLDIFLQELFTQGPDIPMVIISLGPPPSRPPHVHECEPCQYEWAHDTSQLTDREEYENAHKFPKCGAVVRKVKRYL